MQVPRICRSARHGRHGLAHGADAQGRDRVAPRCRAAASRDGLSTLRQTCAAVEFRPAVGADAGSRYSR